MIPEEAVEAAARAILAAGNHVGGWDNLPTFMQDQLVRDARAALEAAAPHMLEEAWEEGYDAGKDWGDKAAKWFAPDEPENPYRAGE